MSQSKNLFLQKINSVHQALNIPATFASDRNLPLHMESDNLVEIKGESNGKPQHLTKPAAAAWLQMKNDAENDGINLVLVSTFRSVEHQRALIERKLAKGQHILDILTLLAPPGYSEHHTGNAIDFTTGQCSPCVQSFENTDAYTWLHKFSHKYYFSLSYPRNNPYGFIYEPWHWAYHKI